MRLISRKTLLLFFLPGAVFMGAFLIYPIITMVIDSFYEIGIQAANGSLVRTIISAHLPPEAF